MLAINHEYTDQVLLFPDGIEPLPPQAMPVEKVRKSIASHGVSIVEISKQNDGRWQVVQSPRARRITADTPISLAGPAKEKLGGEAHGTVNNCAAGRTPWGTYLTCEENFQGVFGTNAVGFTPTAAQKVYGLTAEGFYYNIDQKKVPRIAGGSNCRDSIWRIPTTTRNDLAMLWRLIRMTRSPSLSSELPWAGFDTRTPS